MLCLFRSWYVALLLLPVLCNGSSLFVKQIPKHRLRKSGLLFILTRAQEHSLKKSSSKLQLNSQRSLTNPTYEL